MTDKSQQVEDIQEFEDVQEATKTQEVQQDVLEAEEVQQEQDVLEAEDVQEEQDVEDDKPQLPDDEQPGMSQVDEEITTTVESVIEAVLFASDEPLTDARLASIVETSSKQVRQHIKNLNDKYQSNNNAFRIEQIAGGNQMLTLSPYNHWLKKLLRARSDNKLSPAAMETLAIIAYKQPVMRADIEAIRGVAVGEVIRSLSYKGLVKIVGRAEVLGRPMLYGTTKKFLEVFGLNTLKDLPKVQELQEPSS
ncbi:MAG: SMC-Scp complex subunit ScpB [Sedimentisphaerales bacterium]|nr:SMC-Scp complex subunit ScpB [Sedimentisphaerales bacterium]